MKNRIMIILGLTTMLMACGGGGGGGSSSGGGSVAADIDGLDLTGVWRIAGVRCLDSALQNITAEGTPSPSSSVGTIVIQGNQYTSENLGIGSCKVSISRSIVANLQVGDVSGGYGIGTLGATTATVSPSSCSLFLSFNMTLGNITPSAIYTTYTNAQAVPQQSIEFLISLPYIGITSLLQVVGRPTDICFLRYQKL